MAINPTAVWRVRPSGSNTNGGGYDPGISGAGTDYSQQNAAQASGTSGTTATTTLTDTGASFTTALIGNGIYVAGTGITTTYTFITGVPTSTTLTLQTSPGTTGSAVTYHIGGGWADFWTNTTSSGPLVPGNTVYILGSVIPNPSAYTYDYSPSTYFTPASGSETTGLITFAADPNTPNYSTGGRPCVKTTGGLFINLTSIRVRSLYFVASGTNVGSLGVIGTNSAVSPCIIVGCVLDQFGYDIGLVCGSSTPGNGGNYCAIFCEVFSSQAKVSTNAQYGMTLAYYGGTYLYCNVHNCIGPGIYCTYSGTVNYCISAKNGGTGIYVTFAGAGQGTSNVNNNTVDGNAGHGIEFTGQQGVAQAICSNNIISNHTGVSKYGLTVDAGTAAANSLIALFCDYNTFYNNTTNYNAINAGPHDTALGTNPYVGQSTENYTLA